MSPPRQSRSPLIFISYRIADTLPVANHLAESLRRTFGDDAVFFADSSLKAGEIWDRRTDQAVQSAKIALVLIGKKWLTEHNQYGIRRLDEANDWVRREIEISLAQDERVIPVLVDGATLPPEEAFANLPSLKDLTRCQAVELRTKRWDADVRELVSRLEERGLEARSAEDQPRGTQDLDDYLNRLVEKFRWLKLQDLREAGPLEIELEKVYIALKTEPESEYELQQSSKLHETEVLEDAGAKTKDVIHPIQLEDFEARNIRRTYKPARDEVKRARMVEVHTFGDAFRQHHRMVVLGGPGSGKTTLGRWLALQLAKARTLALETEHRGNVTVLKSHIDPDVDATSDEWVDLGPARVPIFLRLSHYARELASLERDRRPAVSLADYLGRDPDSEELRDGMTPEERNRLFRAHLARQDAVVILDGLDELSEANRGTIVGRIQELLREHIPETDAKADHGLPYEMGGNQVLVTSRYVGYKYHSIRAGCEHLGIQPMRRPAVERFAHAWSDAVNAALAAPGFAEVDADRFLAELFSPARSKVRELATNPLLITVLATVYWRDGKLPDQRAAMYDRVIENLVEVWLKREECRRLTREQLLAALEPLAADLQETSNNGLVSLERIADIIEAPLAHVSGIDDPSDRRFREQLDGLLETIRKHVGLLAEQSKGNYAFFHRTFQEFLAARHLLARRATAAQRIGEKLDDPLWREPLLLALVFVMIHWERESQVKFLTEVLDLDASDALIPRATFLLSDVLSEIPEIPGEIVEQIVARLLASYSVSMEQVQARSLRERIEQMFVRLRQGSQADVVVHSLAEALRRPHGTKNLASAVANIVRHLQWTPDEIVDALLLAADRDSGDLEWPVFQALARALNRKPNERRWIDTASPQTLLRLENAHLPMRKLLRMNPDLVAFAREDRDWLALLIALYGGLDQALSPEELSRHRPRPIDSAEEAASRSPSPAEAENVAPPVFGPVHFSPRFIFWDLQDRHLSRLVQRHLTQRRPARELADAFWGRWKQGGDAGAVDALVGLAALGEDVIPILRESLATPDRQAMAQTAVARFGRLRFVLTGPLVRTSDTALRTIPEGIPEQHQLDLLRVALGAHIACGGAPLEIATDWPEYNFITTRSPDTRASLDAEFWAYVFSGALGEGRQRDLSAPVVAAIANSPSDSLLQAWPQIPHAINRIARNHLPWPQTLLAPRPSSHVESYLAMLDAMETAPREYHSVAGHVLAQCRSMIDANPFLLWETLSICERHGKPFSTSYRMNRAAVWDETSPLQCVLDEWLVKIATGEARELQREAMFDDLDPGEHDNSLTDPYMQFRTVGVFAESLEDEPENLALALSKSLEAIPEIDRIRAVEFMLMHSSYLVATSTAPSDLADTVIHLLPEITDPENRARTFCRLALFMPVHTEKFLSGAIDALETIADPARKASTIDEVRLVWGRAPGMAAAIDGVAEKIEDTWERDKALDRRSRMVQARRGLGAVAPLAWRIRQASERKDRAFRQGSTDGALAWTVLFLHQAASEAASFQARPSSSDARWDDLLDDPTEAVAELIATGLEAGLPVTTRAASILDRIVQEDRSGDLEPLWPYLHRPEPGAVATIARWSSQPGRPRQWSALVQAEAGRLTPDIVSSVIDLLGSSTDLLHLRASLALHGPTAYVRNPARRWHVNRVGMETLEVLARESKRPSNSQALLTTLEWALHDVHHDSPKAVETWLREACEDGEHAPVGWLLERMESADEEVVSVLVSALPTSPAGVQETILRALAGLAHRSHGTALPKDIHTVIAQVPEDVRRQLSILPEGPKTVLDSVWRAVEQTQSGDAWQQALMLMESSSEWLDEAVLRASDSCNSRLQAIGGQNFVDVGRMKAGDPDFDTWKGPYWTNADEAAASLVEDERIQETLIALLAEMESTNHHIGYPNHLLTATEAVSRRWPDAFARLAPPEDWEPVLAEWAEHRPHWSERLAAVRLIGRLRRVTPRVAQALRAAMEDNPYTQHAAYTAVSEFRYIEGDILEDVLSMLDSPSAATCAVTARLLVSTAKAGIHLEDRRRIVSSLQEALGKPSATRPIFLMETRWNDTDFPKFVGTLDETLYQSIFEITGN